MPPSGVPLEGTASSPRRASDGSRQPTPTRPQGRAAFVGRDAELRQLKAAFEAAIGGRGALMLLVGEPGIGKTALCDELGRYVAGSDGVPLVGHCYEEGSFRRPYQPFVEAFETYVRDSEAETLAADLGPDAAELARMVPSLNERLEVTPRPATDPEQDRWRLLDAAARLLRSAATHQPVLLVLEDLHDADRGALDLLLHVSRTLQDARLLVVGTYRDVDVDRAHPLSTALAELYRASHVARLQLRGLSTDEVQRLLAETSQQTIPQTFAELVHRQTDGNPLFARETLRFMIDAALVSGRDGALRRVSDESLSGRIPEGLRDAVGKRLSRLSGGTDQVLSVASVLGRDFELEVLRRVLGGPEEDLEAALQEASTAGIIEERSVVGASIVYRFSHAFFRQTLYDEIVAPRRIRLHQQVARALEDFHRRRLEEHAAELAEHYSFSSETADLSKSVNYAVLAAEQATDVFAYGDAARQLERALVVQDLVDPNDREKRCELLLGLGESLFPAGETERVSAHVAPDAFALAEGLGDPRRAFRACGLALHCLLAQGLGFNAAQPEYLTWAERAIRYADPGSVERSHADLALSTARLMRGQVAEARVLRLEALALAREYGDAEALFDSAARVMASGAPQHWDERVRLAEECSGWPRQNVSATSLRVALWRCGLIQLAGGHRTAADELWRQLEELGERSRVVTYSLHIPLRDAILALLDGHLEDAVALIRRSIERADESGSALRGRQNGLAALLAPALYLGRADFWLTAFEGYAEQTLAHIARQAPVFVMLTAARAMCLAELGRIEEAGALVGPFLDAVTAGSLNDESPFGLLAMLLQAAIVFKHAAAAQALSERLACVAHLTGDGDTNAFTCVARHLGDAAVLVGDLATARAYYIQALDSAGKIRFRPELALTRVCLAELLLQDGDESEAQEQLDLAIPELRDMHMQPALERAESLSDIHRITPPRLPARATGSDALTAREREIASLIAAGLSNREIAERLVISEGTVEVHVKHVLGKLGYRSRSQVVGWFHRHHDERPGDVRT